MSGSKLQDQAVTLKICALTASYLIYIAVELISKHSTSYIYPPKLRDHAPLALKGWMICPGSCFWIKLTAMRWKCSALFLICCRKDLSDRGEVFDPVLSCWGLSERLYRLHRERRSPKHWYFQVSLTLPLTAMIPQQASGILGYLTSSTLHPEQSFLQGWWEAVAEQDSGQCSHPAGSRAPRGATSPLKEPIGCCWTWSLYQFQGQLRAPLLAGGLVGLLLDRPRAVLHAGCRRAAGLGAGRLSIFSEGFIEWIPAVWLHTEILS